MALSRRTVSVTTVVVLLTLMGTGIWWRLRTEAGSEDEEAETAEQVDTAAADLSRVGTFSADEPDPVEGDEAILDTLWIYVRASARARAVRSAEVAPRVAGVVREVAVGESDRVAAGDALLRIDSTELAMEVERARAGVLQAQATFERLTLFDELEVDDPEVRARRAAVARAESGLDQAESALREAELQVERATVRAPFAGRIADVDVSPGEHVTAGSPLMRLLAVDPVELEVDVLESAVPDLVEGRAAEVRFAAFPGQTFRGVIHSVNPVISPDRRAARVLVRLPNPDGRIIPGMYAEVGLQARAYPDRILVPRAALLERGQGERRPMLFVYEDGRAKWRYVNPGLENERYAELLPPDEGPEDGWVEPGETVLVDGHHYLAHDTRVTLVESVFAAGGRPGR